MFCSPTSLDFAETLQTWQSLEKTMQKYLHDRYWGGLIMVFDGIGWDGRTEQILRNRGTLTWQQYIYEILKTWIRL